MISKILRILICVLIILFFIGCATTEKSKAESSDNNIVDIYGTYDNGIYMNKYYGFKLNIPKSYVIQDEKMREHALKEGTDFLYKDEASREYIKELAAEKVYNILMCSKYEIGAPVLENLLLQIMSENLIYNPGVKTGADYLWHVQKLFKESGITLNKESGFLIEEVNGLKFYTYSYEINVKSVYFTQKWYTKKVGDHMLCFAFSYNSEIGYNELNNIFNTLELLKQTRIDKN